MDAGSFVSGMLVLQVSSAFPKVGIIPFWNASRYRRPSLVW
jgi:hypothetical protein